MNSNLSPEVKVDIGPDDVNNNDDINNNDDVKTAEEEPFMRTEENAEDEKNYLNLLKLKKEIEGNSLNTSFFSRLRDRACPKPTKPKEPGLLISVVILFVLIATALIVVFQFYKEDLYYVYNKKGFTVNGRSLVISFHDGEGSAKLQGHLWNVKVGSNLPFVCKTASAPTDDQHLCLEWKNTMRVNIKPKDIHTLDEDAGLTCHDVTWTPLFSNTSSTNDVTRHMSDCYVLKDDQWFGLGLHGDHGWPLQSLTFKKQAFVTSDPFSSSAFGSAIEPYLVSSSGFSIRITGRLPLQLSMQGVDGTEEDKKICFYVTSDYEGGPEEGLEYTVCTAEDIKRVHEGSFSLHKNNVSEATHYDLALMDQTIWTTSEHLGSGINQSNILQFASHIQNMKDIFGDGNTLIIDRGWESNYGDFKFDETRFENPGKLISDLKNMGFKVGLWVHPMAAATSDYFKENCQKSIFAEGEDDGVPRLVLWWDGPHVPDFQMPVSSVVNFSRAVPSYLDRVQTLRQSFHLDLFQHSRGFSQNYPSKSSHSDANENTRVYASAVEAHSIVESVYENQLDPIVFRLTGAVPAWHGRNSIKSIISDAFNLGLIGYPMFLPQSVAGSTRYGQSNATKELFIRWMQISVFMPILHLSIPPTLYDNETVEVIRRLIQLRRSIVLPELKRAVGSMSRRDTNQLIKPMWMATLDAEGAQRHDQFIVADKILVAPVVDEGVTSRHVYVPDGLWEDEAHDIHVGPKWLYDVAAESRTVPYFIKKN